MRQPRIWLAGFSVVIAAVAMLGTLWILGFDKLQSAEHARLIGLNALPYLALMLIGMVASRRTLSAGIALLGTAATSALGVYSLVDAFYIHSDPQSGLVAVVLPILQWICCGLTVGAILMVLFVKWVVWPRRSAEVPYR